MSSKPTSASSEDSIQTDADLFSQLQNGQTALLAILYDRHAGLVYGIALQLLANTAEAEDLTQDIFLSLTTNCSFDPQRGSVRTYLAILTRSRGLDRLRTRIRQQQKLRDTALDENAGGATETPLTDIDRFEQSHIVRSALEQLSTKEKEVLEMAYYQGLSQSQIAKQLNTALGTIESRSRRGLLKLRQALSELKEES